MDTRALQSFCGILALILGAECGEFLNCRHHKDSLQDAGPGAYVPQCNDAGNYRVLQCHPSTGYCWCVDAIEGDEIEGTKSLREEPECDEGTACQIEESNTEAMPGAYVPQCTEEGLYERVQCYGSIGECWCAHPETNAELRNTRIKFNPPSCPDASLPLCRQEEEVAAQREGPVLGAYDPQCDEDGSYKALQCHGSTGNCWCVNTETNEEIPDTRTGPGEPQPSCPKPMPVGAKPVQERDAASAVKVGMGALCLSLLLSVLL